MANVNDLAGKVAVVTGGASGIGRAVALELAANEARLCIADINLSGAEQVAQDIRASGGDAFACRCDIGSEEEVREAVEAAVARFGRLDIMHNNAALIDPETLAVDTDILTMPTDVWDRVMQVTLRGTMLGCRYAVKAMLDGGGGSIVNTSSMISLATDNILPAYSTAKAGINRMTQWVAAKYGRFGVRCNAVAPSVIRTPLIERAMPADYVQLHADAALTPFLGTPEDVAAVVLFLASERSRYMTGQILRVDGGSTTTVPIYGPARRFFANGAEAPQ